MSVKNKVMFRLNVSKNKNIIIVSIGFAVMISHIMWLDSDNTRLSKQVDLLTNQLTMSQQTNSSQTNRLNELEKKLELLEQQAEANFVLLKK